MQTFIMVIVTLAVIFLFLNWYAKRRMKLMENVAPNEKIIVLSEANFIHQLKGKTILVDFWAEWCMPCKMMAPVLNDLANELPEGYFVGKLNVEKDQKTAQKYNVRNIPTLILFKDGKEINRFVGVKTKEFLKKEMVRKN